MMIDAGRAEAQRVKIERELNNVGIRLNQGPPNSTFKKKPQGSSNNISVSFTVRNTNGLDEGLVKDILKDYKIHNADVTVRDDSTPEQLIDTIMDNCSYLPCVYCYNKIDTITLEEVARLARMPHSVVCSLHWDLNVEEVIDEMWEHMGLIRIFTKKKGSPPDLTKPFVVKKGSTIEHVCNRIHKDLRARFKYAIVWGTSAKHSPQRVGLQHVLEDEDVLQILAKTANE